MMKKLIEVYSRVVLARLTPYSEYYAQIQKFPLALDIFFHDTISVISQFHNSQQQLFTELL